MMELISHIAAGESQRPEPVTDEYVPEKKREPWGRYWPGKDQEGRPKIYFDDPRQPEEDPAPRPEDGEGAEGPRAPEEDRKEERCTADTGKVDRELEALRKHREELARRLGAETDETRREALERQLAQAERELAQKDNDAYRRRHTVFTPLS